MEYDIIVIGGGIVGLASALKIKQQNPTIKLAILEKETELAAHQTGNNSGVIHSGIYYKPGSLKAKNCIAGYKELIHFAAENNIPFDICGKLIVATNKEELPALDNIYERGLENGLPEIKKLKKEELIEHEPHVHGMAGIHVPYTGIIDFKKVCDKYGEILEKKYQAEILLNQKVIDIKHVDGLSIVETNQNTYKTKLLINCAGLYSDKIATLNRKRLDVRIIPFRGEYYKIKPEREYLVNNLIYPVPDPAFPFLGVHFTRMMKGGVEAGPNAVFAFKREGYTKTSISVAETLESLSWKGFQKVMLKYWKMGLGEYYRSFNKSAFTRALQKLIPEIQKDDLIKGGAGVRAQACDRNGGLADDFIIIEDEQRLDICNAPSPAATASLSIGKTIAEKALERFP